LNKQSKFIYTDEELIGRFQAGDELAYIELVDRYKDKLLNFIFPYFGEIEQTEDIVQDTMIKLYEKKHYYKEIAKFSTWLYTIAKNLANTEIRKRNRKKITYLSQMSTKDSVYEIPDRQKDTNKEVENEFINERIKLAIAGLPEKFKTVIVLRDIQELSYEDISTIVGVPLGTVKSRINRARIQLQAELQDLKS
tara:strand:+ start:704 stop:1285 length:582 start_codon:yes stop_codon:yes gene_type:complete